VLRDLYGLKTVGIIEEDAEKGLIKIAKPVGVIGALTPVTNASSTICAKGLSMLKTRNAVIFAPHPKAKSTCELTCNLMREGLKQVGAPLDLVLNITEPTVELTQELMKQVDLVVATGGSAMVKVAYSSGTPAYGVGAGNAVVIVDETADLEDAAKKIFLGKTFDNATSCSSENSVIIQDSIFDTMVNLLKSHGGYLCNAEEKVRLKNVMWPDGTHLSRNVVGQSATSIAALANIDSPNEVKFLMVIGESVGPSDMFSAEKLSPVLTLWKYDAFEEAVSLVSEITRFSGYGHSCGIHTTNDEHMMALAIKARVSRIMVRQVQPYGNSGNYDNGMPVALTLGCGTWGGNIVSENVHWKHFLNTTWVSKPIPLNTPDENIIFGEHWEKYGK
ncbi:MAG: aldehyde dehydrogenase family protein, partial [Anaerolineaceae bacterium]|nr:aldehyde dehydrogenase family protein [Anaerolineaceae bacterium]